MSTYPQPVAGKKFLDPYRQAAYEEGQRDMRERILALLGKPATTGGAAERKGFGNIMAAACQFIEEETKP